MTESNLLPFASEKRVIFKGSPSQVVNVAVFAKGLVALFVILAAYWYALAQWPIPWIAPILAMLVVVVSVGLSYLKTAFT